MNTQRHSIKRQLVELQIDNAADARHLQDEFGRIYRQRIVALIDRYCSELSTADALYRIESLELDLGVIDPHRLESDSVARVDEQLRKQLPKYIHKQQTTGTGNKTSTVSRSQLELFSRFARRGSLPWWADSSQTELLENSLQQLLQQAPAALRRLLWELVREQRPLRRIVHYYRDVHLSMLLTELLMPKLGNVLDGSPQATVQVLQQLPLLASRSQLRIRQATWYGLLQEAILHGDGFTGLAPFFEQALVRVAAELGVTHAALLADIQRVIGSIRRHFHSPIAEIMVMVSLPMPYPMMQRAKDKDGGDQTFMDHVPAQHRERLEEALDRLQVNAADREAWQELVEVLGAIPDRSALPASLVRQLALLLDDSGSTVAPGNLLATLTELLLTLIEERSKDGTFASDITLLLTSIRSVADRLPAAHRPKLMDVLDRLRSNTDDIAAWETLLELLQPLLAQHMLPVAEIHQWLTVLRHADPDMLPAHIRANLTSMLRAALQTGATHRDEKTAAPPDLDFSDADELYVNNAGLVILWPFLERFFDRLGLLWEKRFQDAAAMQRAVGLLQYLASEDSNPPEYLLPLNKVMCGMELDELFQFGQALTPEEAEECNALLEAVIANAAVLNDMSVAGFRGSFLLRQGILSRRDGAWLLRVARETYDIVLDRFPWPLEWFKLPWMQTALRVEW